MGTLMVASSSRRLLALVAAVFAVVVAADAALTGVGSCSSSVTVIEPRDDPKCEVMVPCTMRRCVEYCARIGLRPRGFCNVKPDLQVYCCCLVPAAARGHHPHVDPSAALQG
jgi:hypothetical protein